MFKTKNYELAKAIEAMGYKSMSETLNGETFFVFPLAKNDFEAILPSLAARFGSLEGAFSSKLHF